MLKYITKRLLRSLLTLFFIIVIIFSLLRLMPIEGYFQNYDKMTPAQITSGLQTMGLTDPLPVQLFHFFEQLFQGSFGVSHIYRANVPITDILADKAPISIKMGLLSVGLSLLVGLPLGISMVLNASRKKRYRTAKKMNLLQKFGSFLGSLWDGLGVGFIVLIQAIPAAVYYLYIQLYGTSWFNIPLLFKENKPITWVLPVVSLALGDIAYYAMWIRRFMTDELNRDYVQLARAKGVSSRSIMFRHVFRNAFVPLIQYLPSSILYTAAGSIYVESLYSVPGMGGLLVNVIQRQDNTIVQALVLIYSAIGIVALILGDLLMSLADPRITLTQKEGSR